MTPANDNTPAPRPASYDAAILDRLPFMSKVAGQHVADDQREDLVNDAIVLALRKWSQYRPTYRFSTWLALMVRKANRERLNKARTQMRAGRTVAIDDVPASEPAQQEVRVDLAAAITAIPGDRDGDMFLRRCMGEDMAEIGVDYGLSRERVRQICARGHDRTMAAIYRVGDAERVATDRVAA